jgi:hypothetical protein
LEAYDRHSTPAVVAAAQAQIEARLLTPESSSIINPPSRP